MKVTPLAIPEVKLVEPLVFGDARGFFLETYNVGRYQKAGIPDVFEQDNLSYSARGVLRGLHLQHPGAQGKLISVVRGKVFDVAVDARLGSPTFGRWVGAHLTGENQHQLYLPWGFAHGFIVLSEDALVSYKVSGRYRPEAELSIQWNDPELAVNWPAGPVHVSDKDRRGLSLADAVAGDRLPTYDPMDAGDHAG